MGALIGVFILIWIGVVLAIIVKIADIVYTYYLRHRKPKLSAWDKARTNYIDRRL